MLADAAVPRQVIWEFPTHVYVLSQQLVRHLVLIHDVVVKTGTREDGSKQETEDATTQCCQPESSPSICSLYPPSCKTNLSSSNDLSDRTSPASNVFLVLQQFIGISGRLTFP